MGDFDQILPVTDVKRNLLPLIKKIQRFQGSVAITRNGRPAAVILSLDEYEGLLETVEILSDPRLVKILRRSKREAKRGKWFSHREVWGD